MDDTNTNKLSNYLSAGEKDFKITYVRPVPCFGEDGSFALSGSGSISVISSWAMSIDEYSQLQRRRRSRRKSKTNAKNEQLKRKSSLAKHLEIEKQERVQSNQDAIILDSNASDKGSEISMRSVLNDIRVMRQRAELTCKEISELHNGWEENISVLLNKWQARNGERLQNCTCQEGGRSLVFLMQPSVYIGYGLLCLSCMVRRLLVDLRVIVLLKISSL